MLFAKHRPACSCEFQSFSNHAAANFECSFCDTYSGRCGISNPGSTFRWSSRLLRDLRKKKKSSKKYCINHSLVFVIIEAKDQNNQAISSYIPISYHTSTTLLHIHAKTEAHTHTHTQETRQKCCWICLDMDL